MNLDEAVRCAINLPASQLTHSRKLADMTWTFDMRHRLSLDKVLSVSAFDVLRFYSRHVHVPHNNRMQADPAELDR